MQSIYAIDLALPISLLLIVVIFGFTFYCVATLSLFILFTILFDSEGLVRYKKDEQSADEPHYLFLFNDLLLIAQPASPRGYPLVLLLDLSNVTSVTSIIFHKKRK